MSMHFKFISHVFWAAGGEFVSYPEVSASLPVTGSSAGTIGQPRGLAEQSPWVVKYFA
jgi:hypothetical protein